MADAVGAEHAFFSSCGSSLSVKAAMLAVTGHDGHLILGRDAHKSVTAAVIFSGHGASSAGSLPVRASRRSKS
jgi:lysine decarboxylase